MIIVSFLYVIKRNAIKLTNYRQSYLKISGWRVLEIDSTTIYAFVVELNRVKSQGGRTGDGSEVRTRTKHIRVRPLQSLVERPPTDVKTGTMLTTQVKKICSRLERTQFHSYNKIIKNVIIFLKVLEK